MEKNMAGFECGPTPGPWEIVNGPIGSAQLNIISPHYRKHYDANHCVAWLPHGGDELSKANAAVVAAAPEMLQILQRLHREYQVLQRCLCDRGDPDDDFVCDSCETRRVLGKALRVYLGDCCLCNRPMTPAYGSGFAGGHSAMPLAEGQCCSWCYANKVKKGEAVNGQDS